MKDIRKRINKKINDDYNKRHKILSEIRQALDIDFGKISNYKTEIIVPWRIDEGKAKNMDYNFQKDKAFINSNIEDSNENIYRKEKPSFFKINIPESTIGGSQFYYKGNDINRLTLEELRDLRKDLDYILKEIENEIERIFT